MRSKLRYFLLLIFILSLFSCSNGNEFINNENNNEIIELELVLVIDGLQENSCFFEPWDIGVDSECNIYILDPTSCKIHVFDKNGNYLQSIGNKGQAPEEFNFLLYSGFCIDSEQNMFIVDNMNLIKIFTTDGEFVKSINTGCNLNDIAVLDTSNIYVNKVLFGSEKDEMLFDKIDIDGNIIISFGEIQVNDGNIPIKEKINNKRCFMDIDDSGNIYACRMSEYEVFKFDNEGTEIYSFLGETPFHVVYEDNTITPVIFDICVTRDKIYVLWG